MWAAAGSGWQGQADKSLGSRRSLSRAPQSFSTQAGLPLWCGLCPHEQGQACLRGKALSERPSSELRAKALTCLPLPPRARAYGRGHKGSKRVYRGGSWINDARNVRAAYRNGNDPGIRNDNLGFRLAREQKRVGGPAPDPTGVRSLRLAGGRKTRGRRRAGRDGSSRPERSPAPRPLENVA